MCPRDPTSQPAARIAFTSSGATQPGRPNPLGRHEQRADPAAPREPRDRVEHDRALAAVERERDPGVPGRRAAGVHRAARRRDDLELRLELRDGDGPACSLGGVGRLADTVVQQSDDAVHAPNLRARTGPGKPRRGARPTAWAQDRHPSGNVLCFPFQGWETVDA